MILSQARAPFAVSFPLPRGGHAARIARARLSDALADRLAPVPLHDGLIVATELVNNAVMHGEGRIELRAALGERYLRIEVTDEGSGAALQVQREGTNPERGRGLHLVDKLASSWGAYEGTTHVWADIARD